MTAKRNHGNEDYNISMAKIKKAEELGIAMVVSDWPACLSEGITSLDWCSVRVSSVQSKYKSQAESSWSSGLFYHHWNKSTARLTRWEFQNDTIKPSRLSWSTLASLKIAQTPKTAEHTPADSKANNSFHNNMCDCASNQSWRGVCAPLMLNWAVDPNQSRGNIWNYSGELINFTWIRCKGGKYILAAHEVQLHHSELLSEILCGWVFWDEEGLSVIILEQFSCDVSQYAKQTLFCPQ